MIGKRKPAKRSPLDLTQPPHCSFCNKTQDQIKKLIAGPTAFICDECVAQCVDIMLSDDQWEVRRDGERLQAEVHKASASELGRQR
jgi:hypothetical protein